MKNNTTGNNKVDAMASIQFTGNVTPQMWYKTITRTNGKPYLLAIVILADIVYWYRPAEMRDETTGQLLGYKKKFKADMLQRSYDQFAEMFGESKRSITDAVIFLEALGVIKRVFRTIEIGGVKHINVLFIDLFPEKIYELTYPEQINNNSLNNDLSQNIKDMVQTGCENCSEETEDVSQNTAKGIPTNRERYPEITGEVSRNNGRGIPTERERCPEITGEVFRNNGTQNTKITTNITTNNKSSSESTSGQEMQPLLTDEDRILKEQIFYDAARQRYPPIIVDAVFIELKNRDRQIIQSITPSIFLEICQNILEYASPKIRNKSAYIRKCIDNLIAGQRLSASQAAYHTVNDWQMKQNYDINELEQKILSN
jgi:hypothetical protein